MARTRFRAVRGRPGGGGQRSAVGGSDEWAGVNDQHWSVATEPVGEEFVDLVADAVLACPDPGKAEMPAAWRSTGVERYGFAVGGERCWGLSLCPQTQPQSRNMPGSQGTLLLRWPQRRTRARPRRRSLRSCTCSPRLRVLRDRRRRQLSPIDVVQPRLLVHLFSPSFSYWLCENAQLS